MLLPVGACWCSAPATARNSTLWDSPLQVVVGLMILAAAVGATVLRNRLAAVLLVGVTGYGCGAIFAFHGAPDLALTQFLVETLTAGDLRAGAAYAARRGRPGQHQPAAGCRGPRCRWRSAPPSPRLAVFAMAARTTRPIADLLPDAAYYRGHGANTVNVLLVDIRAWDTMGEISVLLVAATGVASMVFRNRRFGAAPRVSQALPATSANPISARSARTTAPPSAISPGCAAANCATRGTARWCSRWPPASSSR